MALPILLQIVGLISFVFFVIVVIKLFKEKGVLHGILGIICGLYTFIWGWMNADRLNIKNVMIMWSAAILIQIVLGWMVVGSASSSFTAPPIEN